jgi:hypothetical protein
MLQRSMAAATTFWLAQGLAPVPRVLPLVALPVQARHEVGSGLQW